VEKEGFAIIKADSYIWLAAWPGVKCCCPAQLAECQHHIASMADRLPASLPAWLVCTVIFAFSSTQSLLTRQQQLQQLQQPRVVCGKVANNLSLIWFN